MNNFGLYLHIPFCIQKCAYCDFLSAPALPEVREAYVNALVHEIQMQPCQTLDTVFFGGGTPSLLTEKQLERILDAVHARHKVAPQAEISLECNPATADETKLRTFRKLGINRLSIGVQSFSEAELKLLGRAHDSAQAKACIEDAHTAGFKNINLDLMSGLPHQTLMDWENTLQTALSFAPKHISAYSLIVEPGTPFEKRYADGKDLPEEDAERKMYARTAEILAQNGLERYEISNYAQPGYESRHNLKYWNCSPYLAAGLGAHGFDGQKRTENVCDLKTYLDFISQNKLPAACETVLSKDDLASECIIMGLRLNEGISLAAFSEKFGYDLYEKHKAKLDMYIRGGFMRKAADRLCFTDSGICVSNSILCELI